MRIRAIATATGGAVLATTVLTGSLPSIVATSASGASGPPAAQRGPARATEPYDPSQLHHLGDARQVIVVTASTWKTSYATVHTYRKDGSGWHEQFAPKRARLGSRGFAHFGERRQNSGETPAGTYSLVRAFGAAPDPGTAMRYRQFDHNDWWPYDPRDPRTYNVAQNHGRSAATVWRKSWAEHLSHFSDQYKYALVLDYNLPSGLYKSGKQRFATHPANTAAGGGIFFHIRGTGATAGCVAVGPKAMLKIIRWLDPAAHPVIVMAPTKAIGRA
jgi:L,D-peptidoglycan transpeptidase YkuD (ErfK/YbiS/YcfS/YnhG family)